MSRDQHIVNSQTRMAEITICCVAIFTTVKRKIHHDCFCCPSVTNKHCWKLRGLGGYHESPEAVPLPRSINNDGSWGPAGDQQSVDETQGKRQPIHGGQRHRSKKRNTSSEPHAPGHSLHSQQEMRGWEQGDQGTGQPGNQHRGNRMFIGSEGTEIMGQSALAQVGWEEDEKKTPDVVSRRVMKTSWSCGPWVRFSLH